MIKRLVMFVVAAVILLSGLAWYKHSMSDPSLQAIPQFTQLRIVKDGFATIPAISSVPDSQTVTISHNLGYIPVVVAIVEGGSSVGVMLPHTSFAAGGADDGKVSDLISVEFVTNTTVEFFRQTGATGATSPSGTTVHYYLLRQEL